MKAVFPQKPLSSTYCPAVISNKTNRFHIETKGVSLRLSCGFELFRQIFEKA
ncbi:MAG: hypothetical protein ONB24_05100 [candidate division KSB1 bacterium]|nr:hypothetical protein [candidate division KSB1 bacterium]